MTTSNEREVRRLMERLRQRMLEYEGSKQRGDESRMNTLARQIVENMRRLGEIHVDTAVREDFRRRADLFERGNTEQRSHILADVGTGLLIILATPFAIAGGAIVAAGAIVYGAGTLVKGIGNVLTGGIFQ